MMINRYICNKLVPIVMIMFLIPPFAHAQTGNYVKEEMMLDENSVGKVTSYEYYDGLGRLYLTASNGVNDQGNYVYTMTEYDQHGRENKKWLPAAGTATASPPTEYEFRSFSSNTYNSEGNAFTTTEYDAMGRPVHSSTPGQAWTGKGKSTSFITNAAGDVKRYLMRVVIDDEIQLRAAPPQPDPDLPPGDAPAPAETPKRVVLDGYYPEGTLTGERMIDEDGHSVEVYKNLAGDVVLERRDGNKDTYFIYDKGLLYYVLPPLFQEHPTDTSLLYRYTYDNYGRCTGKTLPGCDVTRYWYDRYGRLAQMQDPRMRAQSKYRFYLYDELGRLAVQGMCTNADFNPTTVATVTLDTQKRGIANTGYVMTDWWHSVLNPSIEIVNYYDGYRCLQTGVLSSPADAFSLQRDSAACATTLLTAQVISTTTGDYIRRVMYYDSKGRLVETRSTGLAGLQTQSHMQYTFTDKPTEASITLKSNGQDRHTVRRQMTYYQNSELPHQTNLSYNSETSKCVRQNTYDVLGRLSMYSTSNLMRDGITVRYSYDIHGWPKSVIANKRARITKLFSETLHYADGNGTAYWNGNVSSVTCDSIGIDCPGKEIQYLYDGMDRMTSAVCCVQGLQGDVPQRYSETVEYNSNSAITHLVREGKTNTGYGYIDRLNYTYRGNRLKAVQDSATTLTYNYAFDFKDNANITTEYAYDPNGAIKYDRNKGVTFAEYDFNGMPLRVQFRNGSSTEYVYAFDGTKLRTIHTTAVSGISCNYGIWKRLLSSQVLSRDTTLYFDGFEMHGDGSARFYHETGYLDISADGLTSHHFLVKDHQGNVRVVVTANGTVEQRNNYFAYGGLLNDATSATDVQTRKYNGKELDRMHGLDLYDYSARQYDAALGCFTSMDPLCEKYYHISPYAYCAGNPVKYVDPTGEDYRVSFDDKNNVVTISAEYYICQNEAKENKEIIYNAVSSLNKYSCNNWKIHKGGKDYSMKINLSVVEMRESEFSEMDSKFKNNINSSIYEGNTISFVDISGNNGEELTVGEAGPRRIVVDKNAGNQQTVEHEIGHTLGLQHFPYGLMTPSRNDMERGDGYLTKGQIRLMINLTDMQWVKAQKVRPVSHGKGYR